MTERARCTRMNVTRQSRTEPKLVHIRNIKRHPSLRAEYFDIIDVLNNS